MHDELLKYTGMAKFLKDALGDRYEVILRQISGDDKDEILSVKDRALVSADEDPEIKSGILKDLLQSPGLLRQDYFCSFSGAEGLQSGGKSSYYFIRSQGGEVIGCLCIYEKADNRVTVREVFDQIMSKAVEEEVSEGTAQNRIHDEIDLLMKESIEKIWKKYLEIPGKLSKKDKMDFIREVHEAGMFRMKGAAPKISEVSGISQASIYRYLGEIIEE